MDLGLLGGCSRRDRHAAGRPWLMTAARRERYVDVVHEEPARIAGDVEARRGRVHGLTVGGQADGRQVIEPARLVAEIDGVDGEHRQAGVVGRMADLPARHGARRPRAVRVDDLVGRQPRRDRGLADGRAAARELLRADPAVRLREHDVRLAANDEAHRRSDHPRVQVRAARRHRAEHLRLSGQVDQHVRRCRAAVRHQRRPALRSGEPTGQYDESPVAVEQQVGRSPSLVQGGQRDAAGDLARRGVDDPKLAAAAHGHDAVAVGLDDVGFVHSDFVHVRRGVIGGRTAGRRCGGGALGGGVLGAGQHVVRLVDPVLADVLGGLATKTPQHVGAVRVRHEPDAVGHGARHRLAGPGGFGPDPCPVAIATETTTAAANTGTPVRSQILITSQRRVGRRTVVRPSELS